MTGSVPLCLFLSGFAFTGLELDLESLSDRNVTLLPISCFPEQYFPAFILPSLLIRSSLDEFSQKPRQPPLCFDGYTFLLHIKADFNQKKSKMWIHHSFSVQYLRNLINK